MMLDERTRILAGLQQSSYVKNELPEFLVEQDNKLFLEQQRILNETKTVLLNFSYFCEKIEFFDSMIKTILQLLKSDHGKEFINGIQDEKYKNLLKYADMVINDSSGKSFQFLEENFTSIKNEIEKIVTLNRVEESITDVFFVSKNLNEQIEIFGDIYLEEKIVIDIPYGSKIIYVSEDLSIVNIDGEKFYSKLSFNKLKYMEQKGFLL